MSRRNSIPLLLAIFAALPLAAQSRFDRWALVLEDEPLARAISSRQDLHSSALAGRAARIRSAQASLRAGLAELGVPVIGAVDTLANAVFVLAGEERLEELRGLPGVARVTRMLPLKPQLDRAIALVNAPAAWTVLGGEQNAGAGVKIGILDSGIDHEHAAFEDASLRPPDGFPKCRPQDCAFTNNKIIVARSYVDLLVLGDQPEYSRPDDLSPRDRVGHGTAAAMVAAGARNTGPAAVITGVAPKAFLANYKIFGSPGVNDVTFDDVVLTALEDAFRDGMDVVNLSLGGPALWGPSDRGDVCGNQGSAACDLRVEAVENAVSKGMTVVVSAGNSGDLGIELPTLNSIHTPGSAPSAITVGATTNSHIYFASVQLAGSGVPADLRRILALFGNGPKPAAPLTAPLRDVSKLEDDGKACSPLTNGSLAGAIALILRGDCGFATKVASAQKAGAVGVVLYQAESNLPFPPAGLAETGIPAVLIGNRDGKSLKTFLETHADYAVTLDPALKPEDAAADEVAFFSSQGPNIGSAAIKPELVAVGTDLYMATQKFDPNGDMYDARGYTNSQGTSFAAPMVAGAVALVKQRNPSFGPAQLKSAVVNTAGGTLYDYDYSGNPVTAAVTAVGAGKLDVAKAVRATVTVTPPALSFGVWGAAAPVAQTLRIANNGSGSVSLRLDAQSRNARLSLSASSLSLSAGQTAQVTARIEGSRPAPGAYEGYVSITGGGADLRAPFLYLVGAGSAFNAFPLRGFDFVGNVNELLPGRLAFKLVDRYGVPVANAPVTFRTTLGGGVIDTATPTTDDLGIGEAKVYLGPRLGEQGFVAEAGGLKVYFDGRARLEPIIETGGVVNAASGRVGQGLAPGSYISIFGRGLSEAMRFATTPSLPLALAGVSVSFDVPARKLSLPGRLHFVSDSQINVQAPWELQGLTSVLMKVSIGDSSSALYDVPLNDYSPALFEYTEPASGRLLAAAFDENNLLVGTSNQARRGRPVQLFLNGLGPVDNQPPTGEPSPTQPLAMTRVTPSVTIGGRPAQVAFSGLAPQSVGQYQINAVVPPAAPTGIQAVVVSVNGVSSKVGSLPIQ